MKGDIVAQPNFQSSLAAAIADNYARMNVPEELRKQAKGLRKQAKAMIEKAERLERQADDLAAPGTSP